MKKVRILDEEKTKKLLKKLMTGISEWSDEECLAVFSSFFERINLSSQFIENDDGLLTHQVMTIQCGDKIIVSDPSQFDWPLQVLPRPQALSELN